MKKQAISGADQEKLTINGTVIKKTIKDNASTPATHAMKNTTIKAGIINAKDNNSKIILMPLLDILLFPSRLGVNFSSIKSLPLKNNSFIFLFPLIY